MEEKVRLAPDKVQMPLSNGELNYFRPQQNSRKTRPFHIAGANPENRLKVLFILVGGTRTTYQTFPSQGYANTNESSLRLSWKSKLFLSLISK